MDCTEKEEMKKRDLFIPSLKIRKEDFALPKKYIPQHGHFRKCKTCGITVGESFEFCGECESLENTKNLNIERRI